MYETLPSLAVALYRTQADIVASQTVRNQQPVVTWHLPILIRNNLQENANLLCWGPATRLSQEQMNMLTRWGIFYDIPAPILTYQTISNLPINIELIQNVAGILESAKNQTMDFKTKIPYGSIAQTLYAEAIDSRTRMHRHGSGNCTNGKKRHCGRWNTTEGATMWNSTFMIPLRNTVKQSTHTDTDARTQPNLPPTRTTSTIRTRSRPTVGRSVGGWGPWCHLLISIVAIANTCVFRED